MKKLLTLLFISFVSISAICQSTERNQKLNKVVEKNSPPPRQNISSPQPVIVQPNPYVHPYGNLYGNPYRYNRRYGWGRRSMIIPSQPIIYHNTPTRGRVNRNIDIGLMTTLGIYDESRPTVGLRFLSGGKQYYGIFGLEASARNPYSHYNNITIVDVDEWEDTSVGQFTTTNTIELGMGIVLRDGLYVNIIGYGTTNRKYLAFMDEEYVLSPNGQYSINGETKTLTGLQLGVSRRTKRTIISMDLGLLGPKRLSIGMGLLL